MKTKRSRYSAKYFKENLPEKKRLDDSVIIRYFHRPISFAVSSLCCRLHISANMVSFISIFVGLLMSGCFLIDSTAAYALGVVLINCWMILDCVDGNIARSVKSEPYGEFLDGASGYILASSMYICIGVAAYRNTGILFEMQSLAIICMGAVDSISEALARLLYQKFRNVDLLLQGQQNGVVLKENDITDPEKNHSIKVNIGKIGAWIYSPVLLVMSIMRWFDLFILISTIYNLLSLIGTMLTLFWKVIKAMRAS